MPRLSFPSTLALLGATLLPVIGAAADAARFAAPAEPVIPDSASGMVRMMLALGLVLALVFAAAWLMRRLRVAHGQSAQGIQVISQVSLGARERAVVIRIAGRDLLLGVAPGNVRTLLVLEPSDASPAVPADASVAQGFRQVSELIGNRPSFRELLRRSLGR
jgi:flagellar protein FliO/FliZ